MQKKFGQNFLINPEARCKLLDALELNQGDEVWEIGAGLGAMSAGLLERGARLTAVEIDKGFCAALKLFFDDEKRWTLVEGNALDTLETLSAERARNIKLFGNLPYNIAAPLIARCIERGRLFPRIVVTVQREVARRIAAKPGSADYSSLSLLVSSAYRVKLLSVLSGECFFPPPHVESQAVRLDLLPQSETKKIPALFYSLIRVLFAARRKTIKNNLAVFIKSSIKGVAAESFALQILAECGISPLERAEKLNLDAFLQIAEKLDCQNGAPECG